METLTLKISIAICLVAIIAAQIRHFGTTTKTRSANNVASFFYVHEMTEKRLRHIANLAALTPLTFIFLVVASDLSTFGKAIVDLLQRALGIKGEFVTPELLSMLPQSLYPFVLLAVSYLLFGAQIKFLYHQIEKCVVFSAGVLGRTNRLLRETSELLLSLREYRQLLDAIEEGKGSRMPLAEELDEANERTKLSFQLLQLVRHDVAEKGLRKALAEAIHRYFEAEQHRDIREAFGKQEFLTPRAWGEERPFADSGGGDLGAPGAMPPRAREPEATVVEAPGREGALSGGRILGAPVEEERQEARDFQTVAAEVRTRGTGTAVDRITDLFWRARHIMAGTIVYLLVCGLYVGLVPMFSSYAHAHGIVWPMREYTDDLLWSIATVTLATVVPSILGVALLARFAEAVYKSGGAFLIRILGSVFMLSLLVNFFLQLRMVLEVRFLSGGRTSQGGGMEGFEGPELVYVVSHALVPCLAVLVIALTDPERILSIRDKIYAVLVIGAGHFVAYMVFEYSAGVEWHYYWHQALLGMVLSAAALVTMEVLWKAAGGRLELEVSEGAFGRP